MKKLQTMQNKLLKVLLNKDYRYGTNQLHEELNILNVNDIYKHSTLNFVYKCLNNETLPQFTQYFNYRENIHTHSTRNRQHLTTPQIRTEVGRSLTYYAGAVMWNSIDPLLKSSKSINIFKRETFKLFVSSYI